jgi:hypothetical protein
MLGKKYSVNLTRTFLIVFICANDGLHFETNQRVSMEVAENKSQKKWCGLGDDFRTLALIQVLAPPSPLLSYAKDI